ncbi:tRNA methyltransferase 10 -like protein C [Channa argus]|uniref:tRNA methyltransferase 10 homolog C n=1 Tax=Channa argus TaxID=215402 RepID=A0A6G1P8I6_CHAAH|nr:tRNA methyltransferase 10 -like protein C [Channa argus]KAK2920072.1 hypothetical protein Q8A73_002276 [Channa argus]
MLRLFAKHVTFDVSRGRNVVTFCVTKRHVISFLPVSSVPCNTKCILSRHINSGRAVWKDALRTKTDDLEATETIELDKWKSVMRSKVAVEEKQQDNNEEEASGDENLDEPGDDLKVSSSLEATRDLVAMWRQAGKFVPQEMTDEDVQTLAELPTKSARKKYLKYLAIKEGHKRANKEKRQQRNAEKKALLEQKQEDIDAEDGGEQIGQELKNTFLLQFWNRSLEKLLAWRSAQAMLFGQPLVFDMSFDSNMSSRELKNTVTQLMEVEGWNRRATEPFHLHFCNLLPDGAYKKELLSRYGAEAWDRLFITSTHRQHVDLFPREKLVYLTADSPNVLRNFDHSKVYIIGAMVDRSIQSGLSLANAKRLKLATARLPLDEFLHWEIGAKNLTLDQMIRIMLTAKDTGKWEEALKFVPIRKHGGFHQQHAQRENTNYRVRGLTNHKPREDGNRLSRPEERNCEKTIKNGDLSLFRSHKERGFTGRDKIAGRPSERENKAAAVRVRTSLKSNMEGRKSAGRSKTWWDDE